MCIESGIFGLIGVLLGTIFTYIFTRYNDYLLENKKKGRRIYYKLFTELKYCFQNINTINNHSEVEKISIKELKNKIETILDEDIDVLDKKLFGIYHCLKSNKYSEKFGGEYFNDINYLDIFSELLSCMYSTFKCFKLVDKILLKEVEEQFYRYKIWHLLMENFQSWSIVERIFTLNPFVNFKLSNKEIYKNKLLNKLIKNINNIDVEDEEIMDIFSKYCFGKISNKDLNNIIKKILKANNVA